MTVLLTNRLERIRFYKFALVGIVGAVLDFGVMNLLTHLFGFSLTLAGSISFVCAVASNFTWNRIWTYPDSRSRPLAQQLSMFFLVNLAGIGIRIPILHFVEPLIDQLFDETSIPFPTQELLTRNSTLALAIGVVLLWNFFVNRYWTYNDIDEVKI